MNLDKSLAKAVVEINQTANTFRSSIVICTDDKHIDAKSILGLTYSVLSSKTFKLEIHGPDEEKAKIAMVRVFMRNGLPAETL